MVYRSSSMSNWHLLIFFPSKQVAHIIRPIVSSSSSRLLDLLLSWSFVSISLLGRPCCSRFILLGRWYIRNCRLSWMSRLLIHPTPTITGVVTLVCWLHELLRHSSSFGSHAVHHSLLLDELVGSVKLLLKRLNLSRHHILGRVL